MSGNDGGLRKETGTGIKRVGDARKRLEHLEERGIPRQREDFLDLREEIELLLDQLLEEDRIDLETSHILRTKLRRIKELFDEMEETCYQDVETQELSDDKDKQDSKLHIIQLMLSQIFPRLKQFIA